MRKRRRSMLFCPGNNEKMLLGAHKKNPDCLIFDLEDAVAPEEKEVARQMVCRYLLTVDRGNCEVFVRVNTLQTPYGEPDIRALAEAGVKNIRLPMCETAQDVKDLSELLDELECALNLPRNQIRIQCAIESPKGLLNAFDIASASPRVTAVSFGAEDFTNCLGVARSKEAYQLCYARSHIAIAANAAGVDAIDTVFTDLNDMAGLEKEAIEAKHLGFSGKSCIHPKQISVIHRVFTPSDEEAEYARRVLDCANNARMQGLGVITLDGKMIDKPIIERAEKILSLCD